MRFHTAVAVIALCAFAVIHGSNIVRFALARSESPVGRRADAVRAWLAAPGLAAAAREAALTPVVDPADVDGARRRGDGLAAMLAVRPLSSSAWLSLAGIWLVTAQPYQQVLAALTMSSVTGPNEGPL